MQQNDFEGFQQTIENVYSFYGKDCSTFALDVWWQALKPYDLEAVRSALGRHCVNPDNGQWLPKPADVVRMMEGSTLDSAIAAWTKIDRAVQSVGTYETVVFDDALIHAVISDMGGWPQLGQKTVDEWPFVAKEFQARYRSYKARNETPVHPPKLIGIFDMQNTPQGFKQQDPVLIGKPAEAIKVLENGNTEPKLQTTPLSQIDHEMLKLGAICRST